MSSLVRFDELEAPGRYLSRVERFSNRDAFPSADMEVREIQKAAWTGPIDDFKGG